MKKKAPSKEAKKALNYVVVLRTKDNLLACGLAFDQQKDAEVIAKEAIISHQAAWDSRLSQNVPIESAYVCKVVSETSRSAKIAKRKQ